MSAAVLPISPLSLSDLVRDLWGQYDPDIIAQLAPLAFESCYQPKFYVVPALQDQVVEAYGYRFCGLKVTPGSILYGFYLPALVSTFQAAKFNLQITDVGLRINGEPHKLWDEPCPSYFCANYKPTYLSALAFPAAGAAGSFPSLFQAPHPVVSPGMFNVEIWETSGEAQRIQLVIGALEVIG